MDKVDLILNIQCQTQLLESLGWDEELLAQLLKYLDTEFSNFEIKSPEAILNEVEEHFGPQTSEVLRLFFKEQLKIIKMNSGGSNYEH